MQDLLAGLNPQQQEAVLEIEKPVLILAGAGSGKTRVITHKIAYLISKGYYPSNILALTFTKKAAMEMRERVIKLLGEKLPSARFNIGTFHAFGARILRQYANFVDLSPSFTIYDELDQLNLLKSIIKSGNFPVNLQASLAGSIIKKNKLAGVSPQEFLKYSVKDQFDEYIYRIYKEYQKRLRALNAVDFTDLLLKTLELLKTNKSIRQSLANRFRYILVDEYQDTNPPQYEIVYLLAKDHRKISVVGDEDQSIYSWRGATVENIERFRRDFPEHKLIKLERNYRSTQNILNAANTVISKNPNRIPKKLWTDKQTNIPIKMVAAMDPQAQARYIVSEISKHYKDDLAEVAVLYRMNHESRIIEEVFLKYGIPYKLVGGVRFYERMEVKDMLAYLKFIANPKDQVSLLRIINTPHRGVGPKALELLRQGAKAVQLGLGEFVYFASMLYEDTLREEALGLLSPQMVEKIEEQLQVLKKYSRLFNDFAQLLKVRFSKDASPEVLIQTIFSKLGYKAWLEKISSDKEETEARIQNVLELQGLARNKGYSGQEGILKFLEEIALMEEAADLEEAKGGNKVTLMTIHSAKGLEFKTVFIVDVVEGFIPHQRAYDNPQQLQEERRLFYVAITRAKENLYIIYPQRVPYRGMWVDATPSTFLEDIPRNVVEFEVAE